MEIIRNRKNFRRYENRSVRQDSSGRETNAYGKAERPDAAGAAAGVERRLCPRAQFCRHGAYPDRHRPVSAVSRLPRSAVAGLDGAGADRTAPAAARTRPPPAAAPAGTDPARPPRDLQQPLRQRQHAVKGAAGEGGLPDGSDGGGNDQVAREGLAPAEAVVGDLLQSFREAQAAVKAALVKGVIADGRQTLRKGDLLKLRAVCEGGVADGKKPLGEDGALKGGAGKEGVLLLFSYDQKYHHPLSQLAPEDILSRSPNKPF